MSLETFQMGSLLGERHDFLLYLNSTKHTGMEARERMNNDVCWVLTLGGGLDARCGVWGSLSFLVWSTCCSGEP